MRCKKCLIALMLSTLSASAMATTELTLWEDLGKSQAIAIAIADFEQQYDAKIKIEEMDYVQTLKVLKDAGPEGKGPDVLLVPSDRLGAAVEDKLITPMANATGDNINDYVEDALNTFTINGTIYGYPQVMETIMLYYNQDKLPKPLRTLDDYFDFSMEQKAKGEYGLVAKFDQLYYAFGTIFSSGGYIFNRDEKGNFLVNDIGLNNQGTIDAITYLKKFYSNGLIPDEISTERGTQVMDQLFTEQKAAAVINGPWAADVYTKAGVNFGAAPLPRLANGKNMSSLLGVRGYVISNWSQNKELAEKFIQFLNQPQYAAIRFEQTSEIPALNSLLMSPSVVRNKTANAVTTQAIHAQQMPSVPEMTLVWDTCDASLNKALNDKQDIKAALDEAVAKIKADIAAYRAQK